MKKILTFILVLLSILTLTSCKDEAEIGDLKFTQYEYNLKSGESVAVKDAPSNTTYEIVNNQNKNIKIDAKTGVVTFDSTIPNYSQILVVARCGEEVSTPCVVTLYYEYVLSDIRFTNRSTYISNNEYINAVSSMNYSVRYHLKNEVKGISINQDTGKVTYAPIVEDGTVYTIVANSHGSISEMTFIAMTKGFVRAQVTRQALSKTEKTIPAVYPLDFSESELDSSEGIVTVLNSLNEPLDEKYYNYNLNKNQLEIDPSYVDLLPYGVTTLKIVTKRNTINVDLDVVTKFIYSAEDLDSIDDSEEALSGYYILMKDIDLTEYLSADGAGYNDGKGWTPLGSYTDTLDTTVATKFSFKGTFDGNGHVISGLYANRKDIASFNAGLFGYITSSATIKNLGVVGELTVSSYSGGLVGSNSGLIENCWADVKMDVYSGESDYRYVGGFVGNNFGTITNCYSIGDVQCDRDYGRFAGSNQGSIINCYSYVKDDVSGLVGAGYQAEQSTVFSSLDEMKSFNWSGNFPNDAWLFKENTLPSLTESLKDFNIRGISLNISDRIIYTKEKISLDCIIYPSDLTELYIDDLSYSVEGDGAFLIGDYVYTDNTASNIKVTATLTVDGITYTDSVEILVKKKIDSLTFISDLTSVEVGNSYLLEADFLPVDAEEKITYHLNAKYKGVSISGNILTISDEYYLTDTISLYATSESGQKSNIITLEVIKHNKVPSGASVVYLNDNNNFTYTFDESTDLNGVKVTLFGKEVDVIVNDNTITIDKEVISQYKDFKARFIFTLANNEVYAADAYYFSHESYTNLNNLPNSEVLYINSVDDFFTYFNADPIQPWSEEKLNNYDKTFILTTDLDFNNKVLYGIGTSDVKFSGKFYGMGHTISNFIIKQNERVNLDQASSSYYSVGLFASVDGGEFYDITVKNANVSGKNFVGALIGMISSGVVENCRGIDLKVSASEYEYSAEDIYVGKIIGRNYKAKTLCVYYNGLSFNAIG